LGRKRDWTPPFNVAPFPPLSFLHFYERREREVKTLTGLSPFLRKRIFFFFFAGLSREAVEKKIRTMPLLDRRCTPLPLFPFSFFFFSSLHAVERLDHRRRKTPGLSLL